MMTQLTPLSPKGSHKEVHTPPSLLPDMLGLGFREGPRAAPADPPSSPAYEGTWVQTEVGTTH